MRILHFNSIQNSIFILIVSFLILPTGTISGQIYQQTFNASSVPGLPNGWLAIADNIGTPSESIRTQPPGSIASDYPGASGGIHLFTPNCQDVGNATITLISDENGDPIATTGLGSLTVSFGERKTNAFTDAVLFEWSSNSGMSWNLIDADVAAPASTTWDIITFNLAAAAENQASLWFKWSYTATGAFSCTVSTPNFRIDDFSIQGSALPVVLSLFKGSFSERQIKLNWTTQSETNNSHFEIQHSNNGRNFRKIGEVDGSGFSNEVNDYFFTHKNPVKGINYYRLKQIDFDGRFEYSKTISVKYNNEVNVNLYPTLAREKITLQLPESDLPSIIGIYDLTGRRIMQVINSAGVTEHSIEVSGLQPGHYFVKVFHDNKLVTKRFVKQS